MKKRKRLRNFAAIVALCVLAAGLSACGGGEANWDGAFYMEVDENNSVAFDITKDSEDYISFTRLNINTYGGGTATTSVTGGAELTNGSTAKSAEFKFTLSGDTLTVKALSEDEYYTQYEGRYTRGEPLQADDEMNDDEESYEDSEDEDSGEEVGGTDIVLERYYYWDGDSESDSFYFYDDNTFDYYSPDSEVVTGTWSYDGESLLITLGGQEFENTVEDGGNVIVSPDGDRMLLEGVYSEGGEPLDSESDSEDMNGYDTADSDSATILTGRFYFLDSQIDEPSWYFYDDGQADYDYGGMTFSGEYEITEGEINITALEDDMIWQLIILDESTLLDADTGDIYALLD